jgi:hypothetical protein
MSWGFQQLSTLAIDEWLSKQKGGHYQYLTNQGLILAIITMALSLLSDLAPLGPIKRLKRTLLLISLPVRAVLLSWQVQSVISGTIALRSDKHYLLDFVDTFACIDPST